MKRGIAIGVLVVALVAAVVVLVVFSLGSEKSQVEVEYHGVQGGFTEEGCPYLGSLDAPVVLMEFTDFACSHCQMYHQQTETNILADYVAPGKLRYVAHYYSRSNPWSFRASEAAMCAADQGLYFQFRHTLFENDVETEEDFLAQTQAVGLDVDDFTACWNEGRYLDALVEHIQTAKVMGVSGTPSFKINEQLVIGNKPDQIRQVIEEELAAAGQ
jgi:protein-disulfide isomerase